MRRHRSRLPSAPDIVHIVVHERDHERQRTHDGPEYVKVRGHANPPPVGVEVEELGAEDRLWNCSALVVLGLKPDDVPYRYRG